MNLVENNPNPSTHYSIYSGRINDDVQKRFESLGVEVHNRFINDAEKNAFFTVRAKQVDYVECFLNIQRIVEIEKPDVIMMCNFFDFLSGYMVSAATGIPVIPVFHDAPTELCRHLNSAHRPLLQKCLDISPYYAVSETGARYIAQNYLQVPFVSESDGPVRTLLNGVPLKKFEKSIVSRNRVRDRYKIPRDALVIGDVGRIVMWQKRQHWIIDAVGYLRQLGFKNVYALIVGDGDLKKLKEYAQKRNLQDVIIFSGRQQDSAPYYSAMDIFAHASKEESFGLVTVEALACGLPTLVCTPYAQQNGELDGNGIITNRYNGLIVPSDDKKAFIKAIEVLVRNKNIRKEFSRVARNSVEKFDVKNMAQSYLEVFNEAVNKKSLPRLDLLNEFFSDIDLLGDNKKQSVDKTFLKGEL